MALTKKRAFIIGTIVVVVLAALAVLLYFLLRPVESTQDNGQESPVVSVEEGKLRGEWVAGVTGGGSRYAAFRWIPYADPPINKARFKAPLPVSKYNGTRDATTEGQVCFQMGDNGKFVGSEDCLFLNVYTPQVPQTTQSLLPVLVFIHGGSFISGSSSTQWYGPDFLVTQDIVVVTINYRLSAFGFMNVDNDDIPGNVGIKDQIFALQWIQRNIAKFGGDPNKVTIQGQSAGAACVHWLTLLPEAKGLFRAAILQSGSALQSWGYFESNLDFTLSMGNFLGNEPMNLSTVSKTVLIDPPEAVYMAALGAFISKNASDPGNNMTAAFGPCPQRNPRTNPGEKNLILRDSESYVLNRAVPDVPILMGMTANEWLYFWYYQTDYNIPSRTEEQIEDLITLVPRHIIPYHDTEKYLNVDAKAANCSYEDIAAILKRNIFEKPDASCDNMCKLKKYLDKVYVQTDLTRLARLRAQKSKDETRPNTYLYKFDVRSAYNLPLPFGTPEEQKNAAVHGDDIFYLFRASSKAWNQTFDGDSLAPKTLRRMVKMWANFVKFLNPTPDSNDPDLPVMWTPYSSSQKNSDNFLHIAENLEMRDESIAGADLSHWLDIYSRCREGLSI